MSDVRSVDRRAPTGFRLDTLNSKVGGVCGGIANRFDVDPLIVRLAFVIAAFASLGTAVIVYLAIWLLAQ
ncbi:PspC domain-containing protein [Erythrobacter arachoides]|uniref:PspC domain-containing protein n=1 Tax=Aurantiacibacter arachoides TaxID=1850444 RepID=A0A845A047_9SPHN|nr:PspC domain-containing protein [Aurantiacibacter arachoides]MXO92526.1 PspC domain-containing protein [Aurantiacibacter arachoides]GGD56497.1 hypothetical protein GCM10011411_15620 [Aurantiacibacter arachoides]